MFRVQCLDSQTTKIFRMTQFIERKDQKHFTAQQHAYYETWKDERSDVEKRSSNTTIQTNYIDVQDDE